MKKYIFFTIIFLKPVFYLKKNFFFFCITKNAYMDELSHDIESISQLVPHFQNWQFYSTLVFLTYFKGHLIFKYSVYLNGLSHCRLTNRKLLRQKITRLQYQSPVVKKKYPPKTKNKNTSGLISENKLIHKPHLQIDEVIK